MLGAWPGRPGHFLANGGFKIGFGMAPRVGEVMADLVLEGRDRIPEGFRVADNLATMENPQRRAPRSRFSVREVGSVVARIQQGGATVDGAGVPCCTCRPQG